MGTISPSEFRGGMAVLLDNVPHVIEEISTVASARAKPKLHVRLRNLRTGHVLTRNFQETERLATVEVEQRLVQYSYALGDRLVFMDARTYDEHILTCEQVGDRRWFLREGEEYKAPFLEGRMLDVVVPDHVVFEVKDTPPPTHGGEQTTYKPAVLEGGLEVLVPPFVARGDRIRISTKTREYLGKES